LNDRPSSRRVEVNKLIATGLTSKEIARRPDIGVETADTHRVPLLDRLGTRDKARLVR
jgi:DNA-binding NarL/FixJ family response regulator